MKSYSFNNIIFNRWVTQIKINIVSNLLFWVWHQLRPMHLSLLLFILIPQSPLYLCYDQKSKGQVITNVIFNEYVII